jgi:hypothetical protein
MKKLLLTVALLFVFVGGVNATELPKAMLMGAWCGISGSTVEEIGDDVGEYRWWSEKVDNCGNRGGIKIFKNRYEYHRFGYQGTCRFTDIMFARRGEPGIDPWWTNKALDYMRQKQAPSSVYFVRAKCYGKTIGFAGDTDESWTEDFEIQTSNGWLRRFPLSDGK